MSTTPLLHSLRLQRIRIPFKSGFKHASATRIETAALWVEVTTATGLTGVGESCPREYVTGETLESAAAFIRHHWSDLVAQISDLVSLRDWVVEHVMEIDRNPAAWCGLELALLDLLAQSQACSIETLLEVPHIRGPFQYSAVLGDAPADQFAPQCTQYIQLGFRDFKIKLSGDLQHDRNKLDILNAAREDATLRIRLDANNLWPDAGSALEFLNALPALYFAVEEPLRVDQSGDHYAELSHLSETLGVSIILDESFLREEQFAHLSAPPQSWIINLRVSKMGGLIRSLVIVEQAKRRGLPLIIGAQVGETSLLTRAAWTVAQLAGDALLAQEGAFGTHLLCEDVHTPALMFGSGGRLKPDEFLDPTRSGWGLTLSPVAVAFDDV